MRCISVHGLHWRAATHECGVCCQAGERRGWLQVFDFDEPHERDIAPLESETYIFSQNVSCETMDDDGLATRLRPMHIEAIQGAETSTVSPKSVHVLQRVLQVSKIQGRTAGQRLGLQNVPFTPVRAACPHEEFQKPFLRTVNEMREERRRSLLVSMAQEHKGQIERYRQLQQPETDVPSYHHSGSERCHSSGDQWRANLKAMPPTCIDQHEKKPAETEIEKCEIEDSLTRLDNLFHHGDVTRGRNSPRDCAAGCDRDDLAIPLPQKKTHPKTTKQGGPAVCAALELSLSPPYGTPEDPHRGTSRGLTFKACDADYEWNAGRCDVHC